MQDWVFICLKFRPARMKDRSQRRTLTIILASVPYTRTLPRPWVSTRLSPYSHGLIHIMYRDLRLVLGLNFLYTYTIYRENRAQIFSPVPQVRDRNP